MRVQLRGLLADCLYHTLSRFTLIDQLRFINRRTQRGKNRIFAIYRGQPLAKIISLFT